MNKVYVYYLKKIIFYALCSSVIFCQPLSIKGMMALSILTSNDIPDGWSHYESKISYLPTLSIKKDFSNNAMLDIEWAYRINRDYIGESLYSNVEKQHRLWLRYSNEKIEARIGLQKIVFAPAQILRPLSWFDTFDVKDPTGQTNGINALKLKWFPSNHLAIWSWLIKNDIDTLSYGGRTEVSSSFGEIGLTIHADPSNSEQIVGQPGISINSPHERFAIDYRYDGFIGLWNETAFIQSKKSKIIMSSIGFDYTLPLGNGIYLMGETMLLTNKNEIKNQNYSAFMASMPIGIMHAFMCISQIDWTEEKIYHYIRWSSTFDKYSLNCILSLNPKRNQYNIPENILTKSIAGFGAGIQFMFIYYH
ncbi:MAG: hypothetical protein ACJZ12_04275 [Candidatus Neomarinimicrobiota bacterium]